MCGIAALFKLGTGFDASAIVPMTRRVSHRGPDGEGFIALSGETLKQTRLDDASAAIALGHRRLSIIDLSDAGLQPMRRGDLWLVFNGEIFNFVEVKQHLERLGRTFVSHSDTEVLLAAWEEWGPACLERLRGMWGFVLVDVRTRRAWLCRDRMGIKPLHFLRGANALGVGSEIKQLETVGRLVPREAAVSMYLQTGYEDPAQTFFERVESLTPGTWRELALDSGKLGPEVSYWNPERVQPTVTDPVEAAERFDTLFRGSVRIHLRSDVPVGCALSGGLDSSSIAALVVEEGRASGARLETFSARFPGFALDESPFIDEVVRHTRAQPHSVEPTAEQLLADLDRLLWCHDEPPGSLSQYAAYAVARLTRAAAVPVTLNGQGGDEVLGGYWQTTFAELAAHRTQPLWLLERLGPALLPGGNAEVFGQAPKMLKRLVSRLRPARQVPLRAVEGANATPALGVLRLSPHERRVHEIRKLTLPRLLKWDDRNFAAFGVEGRYPFLDHLVIEGCLSFDTRALFVAGWTKEPLRRAMKGHLPESIVRRKGKVGFETPQQVWLRGALRGALEPLAAQASPVHRWIAPRDVEALVTRARAGDRELGQAAVRVLLVDRWLRTKGIDA